MFSQRDRDPFDTLNRFLDAHHHSPGAIKRACQAVEDCLIINRWEASDLLLKICMDICMALHD
jgi:hypothetical protein